MLQEFVQAINERIKTALGNIHTAMPGTIRSFNPDTGLADVLPGILFRTPKGGFVEYPLIANIPVVLPYGLNGDAGIAFPISPGDGCLIIISERPIDYWSTGKITQANLEFDLTSAICIPGLLRQVNEDISEACEMEKVIVRNGQSKIALGKDSIEIFGDITLHGNLQVEGQVTQE